MALQRKAEKHTRMNEVVRDIKSIRQIYFGMVLQKATHAYTQKKTSELSQTISHLNGAVRHVFAHGAAEELHAVRVEAVARGRQVQLARHVVPVAAHTDTPHAHAEFTHLKTGRD